MWQQLESCSLIRLLFDHETIRWSPLSLPADMGAEVPSDCARLGLSWVSRAHHCTGGLDYIVSFPHLHENVHTQEQQIHKSYSINLI